MSRRCKSCGDPISPLDAEQIARRKKFPAILKLAKTHCLECADELGAGRIRNQNINFFGGHYGPLEETGPWQDNAIRAMEEGGAE